MTEKQNLKKEKYSAYISVIQSCQDSNNISDCIIEMNNFNNIINKLQMIPKVEKLIPINKINYYQQLNSRKYDVWLSECEMIGTCLNIRNCADIEKCKKTVAEYSRNVEELINIKCNQEN